MGKFKRSSGVIYVSGDEVLLCKRSPKESLPNVWSVPGGGIEKGESPGQAAIREFNEETSIELEGNIELVGIIDNLNDDGTKRGNMFIFKTEGKKVLPDLDKAVDGFEHTECGFFNVESLPEQKENQKLMDIIKKILA